MKKKILPYAITAILISAVFLLFCAYRQIYPFGSDILECNDDFTDQMIPFYFHVYDALHGNTAWFFDWRTGLGMNYAGAVSHYSLVSPFSLFFLFVRRSAIPHSMIWFILIKLIAMGCSMNFYLSRQPRLIGNPISMPLQVLLSFLYAVNGYTMMYYGFGWMDVAVFAPLLILSADQVLNHSDRTISPSERWYPFLLALILIINLPQAYAVCLFLIAYFGGNLFFTDYSAEEKKQLCRKVLLLTILGAGLAMIVFLPGLLNIQNSYRYSLHNKEGLLQTYWNNLTNGGMEAYRKREILFSLLVPFLAAIASLRKKDTQRKLRVWLLFAAVIPVFIEPVNTLYLNGPYMCFPMRFGYLTAFTLIALGAEKLNELSGKKVLSILLACASLFLSIYEARKNIDCKSPYAEYSLMDQDSSLDVLSRTKAEDSSLRRNYALVINGNSFGNYVPLNSPSMHALASYLGYSSYWTGISDTGGTYFSDALLGIHTVLQSPETDTEKESSLYSEPEESAGGIELSKEPLYSYPFGLLVSSEKYEAYEEGYRDNPFKTQNILSELFFDQDFFETSNVSVPVSKKSSDFSIKVQGRKAVYLKIPGWSEITISCNGETLSFPSFEDMQNTVFPSPFQCGMIFLGIYQDETVNVSLQAADIDASFTDGVQIGQLDLDAFEKSTENLPKVSYSADHTHLNGSVTAEEDGYLFLPVNADPGWTCEVNGKKAEISTLEETLMMIPVSAGENEIQLSFGPSGMKAGGVISMISLLLLMILFFRSDRLSRIGESAAFHLLQVGFIAYILILYFIPVGYQLIHWGLKVLELLIRR